MAEVFAEFKTVVVADDGRAFLPRACGGPLSETVWQGWIEFVSIDGTEVVRTPRETTQPNRTDLAYWATGLTPVYLEGALSRALHPRVELRETLPSESAFEGPAPAAIPAPVPPLTAPAEGVLDPFSVYQKGERLLRRQLTALSPWHLVNIIRAYDLSTLDGAALTAMSAPALVDLIVTAVRARVQEPIEH